MARACGSYPQCHRFKSSRRYHVRRDASASLRNPLDSQKRPVGQVVKTRPFHGCNMGSNPVRVTTVGGLAQLVRAPASHAGGHWFESSSLHQKVPDFARNQELFCLWGYIIVYCTCFFCVTQTLTQKPIGQESAGEWRMASSVPLRLFFVGYMAWLMTLPMVSAASRFIPSVAWV